MIQSDNDKCWELLFANILISKKAPHFADGGAQMAVSTNKLDVIWV
jgi:hypothetical protein